MRRRRPYRRRIDDLAQALAHVQAHVLAPVVETAPGGRRRHDVLIVPGERHAVLLAVAPTSRRRALAQALARLDVPVRPGALGHPDAPPGLLADDASLLRAIVVLRPPARAAVRWLPVGGGHVPAVPLPVLVAVLRDRDHPDEVWRELADGAGGDDGWGPALDDRARRDARRRALEPRRPAGPPGSAAPRPALRRGERRRAQALLARAQAPPVEDWARHEAEPGRVRLWHADPPAVLTVSTVRRRPEIAVLAAADEPDMLAPAAAVAEAVQHSLDLLAQDRTSRAVLRRLVPRRRPVFVQVALEPLDNDVVAYVPDHQPRRALRVPLGVSSTREHPDGQALLLTVARALADALANARRSRPARRRRAADQLLEAWAALPQSLNTTSSPSPVWSRDRFGGWGPAGAAEEATVDRMLQTAAARRRLAPGTRTGADAQALLRQLADDLLADAAALTGTGADAVLACADQLHRAAAARLYDDQDAVASMTGPWWQDHLPGVAPLAAAAPAQTGAAELLVENALRHDAALHGRTPDRPGWRTAAAAAARARRLATLATADHRRLATASVGVLDDGTVRIGDGPGPTDYALYTRLRALTAVTDLVGEPPPHAGPAGRDDARDDSAFMRLADIPEAAAMRPLDDALRQAVGAGLDAIVGTLVAAADHLPTTGTAPRAALIDAAADYTGLPPEDIDAAVEWLTLSRRQLQDTPFEYWKLEARPVRLAAQPFIRADDGPGSDARLLLVPGRIRMTHLAWLGYLGDGRLPIPRDVLRQPRMNQLRDRLDRHRQTQNKDQEIRAHAVARQAGLPCRRDVDPRKTSKHGLALTGQIDLLVAVPSTRRVWVAEVKDPAVAFSPWEAADEIDDFHGGAADTGTGRRRDEIGRLLAKTADVAGQLPDALRLLGVPGPAAGWQARPIVLTRRLTPAAFVADPRVPFALVRQAAVAFGHAELAPGPCLWLPAPDGAGAVASRAGSGGPRPAAARRTGRARQERPTERP